MRERPPRTPQHEPWPDPHLGQSQQVADDSEPATGLQTRPGRELGARPQGGLRGRHKGFGPDGSRVKAPAAGGESTVSWVVRGPTTGAPQAQSDSERRQVMAYVNALAPLFGPRSSPGRNRCRYQELEDLSVEMRELHRSPSRQPSSTSH